MKSAFMKDVIRSIKKSKKRFLSLMLITTLGVTVLAGITAACQDLYYSADQYYDEQNLFDIRILSTLGLTKEDVKELQEIFGELKVEGGYSETVSVLEQDTKYTADMTMISERGINKLYIDEGSLPKNQGEIAVTKKYMDETKKSIGDTIKIEEELEENETNVEETLDDEYDVEIEEEEEKKTFQNTTYKITAQVTDPMDVSNNNSMFRAETNASDFTFYVGASDFNTDVYTCIYIALSELDELDCYSEEYTKSVAAIIDKIENQIKDQRELYRYNSIIGEAKEKITDAETKINEKLSDAQKEIDDAWEEIEEARQELEDGETKLTENEREAEKKFREAKAELNRSREQLTASEEEVNQGFTKLLEAKAELTENEAKLKEARDSLNKEREKADKQFQTAKKKFDQKQTELNRSSKEISRGIKELKSAFGSYWPEKEWNALSDAATTKTIQLLSENPEASLDTNKVAQGTHKEQAALTDAIISIAQSTGGQVDFSSLIPDVIQSAIGYGVLGGSQQVLQAGVASYEKDKTKAMKQFREGETEIKKGQAEIEAGWQQINASENELNEGKAQINMGWEQLKAGEAELNREEKKAKREIAHAWEEIKEGKEELLDGETELIENETEFHEKEQEAKQKIADAYDELKDIDMTQWYVQDRDSLDSYKSLKIDLSSIESIGGVFPVVFLIVAILISLTTMTRMIEEERGLLGTYKALGFYDGAVYIKYLFYSIFACLSGGILGDICGFIVLPKFLLFVLQSMYVLPNIYLKFNILLGIGGVLLFMAGIAAATIYACHKELKRMPATLMRPKAPRSGSRVFLERLPFIWNRLRFLNKVTVRNLFRYKKRFFMTVFGIVGCTSLMLAGFAIKDSVTILMPKQYDEIYQYDLMATADLEDHDELVELLSKDREIKDFINLKVTSVKVLNHEGKAESVTLMVIPDDVNYNEYIIVRQGAKQPLKLEDEGIYITENAASLLSLSAGDKITLQNLQLDKGEAVVTAVVENYLGNNVYIKQNLYETLFEEYKPNSVLAHFSENCDDEIAYANDLFEHDFILSSVSVEALKEDFASNFTLINSVVYVIILLAAGLAFVVLFTLSNTNISERVRELATTKVLGFYDSEVHSYVNKETLILTGIGIMAGLPFGRFLSSLLTQALKMPSICFADYVAPLSFVYASILSFSFAIIVNLITNRTLNRINMVEALKSVE